MNTIKGALDRQTDKCYNSIDLFKFIMAFAVIAMHTLPFVNCKNDNFLNGYDILVKLAVPFFFLASGYLLSVKMGYPCGSKKDLIRLKKQLFKIIKMYLIWTLIYLPLAIYHFISNGTSLKWSVWLYIRGFVFIGEQYNSWPLWYLLSTIYALIVIGIALRLKKNSVVLIAISIIASIITIGFTTLANYGGDLILVMRFLRNIIRFVFQNGRLFYGMVYIPIGMLLAHKRIPNAINWGGLILSFVLNYFIDNSIISSYLSIITAISLFGIIERIELKNRPIYSKLRNMSTLMYLIHMYIYSFYYKIVYGKITYGVDSFLVTAVISAVVSLVYVVVHKNRKSRSNK